MSFHIIYVKAGPDTLFIVPHSQMHIKARTLHLRLGCKVKKQCCNENNGMLLSAVGLSKIHVVPIPRSRETVRLHLLVVCFNEVIQPILSNNRLK